MFKWMGPVAALWLALACGSGSSPDHTGDSTFMKNPCVTAGAAYRFHYEEQPGGTCGPLSDEIVTVPLDGILSAIGCTGKPRYEGCSTYLENFACSAGGSTTTQNGKIEWTPSGSSGHGFVTYKRTQSGAVACTSTYEVTIVVLGKPTACEGLADCPAGTADCIESFCVTGGCIDQDKDGAGVGPGCSVYDCDDTDPTIPGAEVCDDGKDNDCNNSLDEGCPCKDGNGATLPDGSTQPCGGSGDCAGTQTCTGGKWETTCKGGKTPASSETCGNDVDENCNGQEDEGCCPPGEHPCPGFAVCSSNGEC